MELRPITDTNLSKMDKFRQTWKDGFEKDWYFEGYFQKLIITASFLWSVYSLGKFLWGLL